MPQLGKAPNLSGAQNFLWLAVLCVGSPLVDVETGDLVVVNNKNVSRVHPGSVLFGEVTGGGDLQHLDVIDGELSFDRGDRAASENDRLVEPSDGVFAFVCARRVADCGIGGEQPHEAFDVCGVDSVDVLFGDYHRSSFSGAV